MLLPFPFAVVPKRRRRSGCAKRGFCLSRPCFAPPSTVPTFLETVWNWKGSLFRPRAHWNSIQGLDGVSYSRYTHGNHIFHSKKTHAMLPLYSEEMDFSDEREKAPFIYPRKDFKTKIPSILLVPIDNGFWQSREMMMGIIGFRGLLHCLPPENGAFCLALSQVFLFSGDGPPKNCVFKLGNWSYLGAHAHYYYWLTSPWQANNY